MIDLELLGITKIFGHYNLDLLTGFNSVKEHATKHVSLDLSNINNTLYTWRKDFCLQYMKRHNLAIDLSKLHPELYKVFKFNTNPI